MEINPGSIIPQFDEFLEERGAKFAGVVIGASALVLLGTITRRTIDVDILSPEIPTPIHKLTKEFKEKMESEGVLMIDKWFNNGPSSLLDVLPKDWAKRTEVVYTGKALTLSTLGRMDLLGTKLYAYCDRRELDREDLLLMKPTQKELKQALPWVKDQDANPDWPAYVESQFKKLAKDLGHGL